MTYFDSTLDSLTASGGLQAFLLMAMWSTIALTVAWLVARRFRHGSAATRYCVWQSAVAGLLVLPIFFVSLPGIPLGWSFPLADRDSNITCPAMGDAVEIETANHSIPSSSTRPTPHQPTIERPHDQGVETEKQSVTPVTLHTNERDQADLAKFAPFTATPWKWLLAVPWGLGVAIHFGFVIAGLVRTRRLWSHGKPLPSGLRGPLLEEMAKCTPRKNRVVVRISHEIQVPIALGIFWPSILLPIGCEEWPMSRIQMVLAHELAHIERRDIFWQLLARVTAAFYWPHPLVWLAVRRMKTEREQACDDHVLQSGVGQHDYAKGLFEVVAGLSGRMMPLSGGIRMAEPRQIESRLRSILDDSRPRGPASRSVRHGLVLGTICLVMLLALVRPFSPIALATAKTPDSEQSIAKPIAPVEKESNNSHRPQMPKPPRYLSATSPLFVLEKQSAYWVHTDQHVHFVIYCPGFLQTSLSYSEVFDPGDTESKWKFQGTLTPLNAQTRVGNKKTSLQFEANDPDTLTLNGKKYDLKKGRVIILEPKAAPLQVSCDPLSPSKENVEKLGQSLTKYIEALSKKNYTFPISVLGRALDLENQPVAGATIYLVSQRGDYKRLGKTTTDEQGRYAFHDVPLPIERADTNHDRDTGAFLVYGQANGYGFTWRPLKWFYPQPNNDTFFPNKNDDLPRSFQVGEKIELDLTFSLPATLRGRIVDDRGKPIANTRVMLWDCEPIRPDGYPTEDAFHTFWSGREFEILSAHVPASMKICKTDADGRFEFAELPPDCRFRIDVRPPGFPGRMVWAATCNPDHKGISGYPMYIGQMDLTFTRPHQVSFLVLYDDTGKPASKVFVNVSCGKEGSTCKTSNQKGLVTLRLPPGKGKVHLLPAKGTPYLVTDMPCEIPDKPEKDPIIVRMQPAGVAEINVIDADTGKGIENVDLWIEKFHFPTPDGPPRQYRTKYHYRSWEAETHISHVEPGRTNADGFLRVLFKPGTHRIGVGLRSLPEGYRVVEHNGVEIDAVVGKPTQVTFHMKKLP